LTSTFPINLEAPIPNIDEEKIQHAVQVVAAHALDADDFKDLAEMMGLYKDE